MTTEPTADRPSRARHREVLAVALGVAILAPLMEVRDDQRVAFRGWAGYPAPELCFARSWFGVKCPGCGLTRGMIHLAHADWAAATEVHRLSGLMAFAILIQIPYRAYCLRTGRLPFGTRGPRLFGHFLIAALFVNWTIGLAIGGPRPRNPGGPGLDRPITRGQSSESDTSPTPEPKPMGQRDERVDAYIAKSAEFARPILEHLRQLVHEACPEAEEAMKWSFPNFLYKGMFCGMAAFKEHCAFGFWKSAFVLGEGHDQPESSMGSFGRIARLSDLPPDDVLIGYIRKAMKLNDEGVKSPSRAKPKAPRPLEIPDDLTAALASNDLARATFEKFSTTNKREYADWIAEAKTQATRARRLETAIEWMAEGKTRNWKYSNC